MNERERIEKMLHDKYGKLLLSAKEVAQELGIHKETLLRMIRQGKINTSNSNHTKHIPITDVAPLIAIH